MLTAAASGSFITSISGAPTVRVGISGVRLITAAGTTPTGRATTGITEYPSGSGIYFKTMTAPATPGNYFVMWDTGSVTPSTVISEELLVLAGPVLFTQTGASTVVLDDLDGIFKIKQNDTRPRVVAALKQDGVAVNLTGATVKFLAKSIPPATTATINVSAILTDAANGVVTATLSALNTAVPGDYNCEFEVTYSDGGIQTFPNDGYFEMKIISDLG